MRRAEEIELAIAPKPVAGSLQAWLYGEIRAAILDGRLKPGNRLPASRDFARQQGISRSTVLAAYEQLAAEGYLNGSVGSGTRVSELLPAVPQSTGRTPSPEQPTTAGRLSAQGRQLAASPFPSRESIDLVRPFRPNQPDLQAFPLTQWNRIAAQRAKALRPADMVHGDAEGYLPLRRAIAHHLSYAQRIVCQPEQIMIVGSAQQALDLCARLLLDPGDEVWLEDPGYPGASRLFESAGGKVVGIPVDTHGIDVANGIARAPLARLAYVTAAHQSPLGMALALERRLALLGWADQHGATIIEDDYDGEYRFAAAPLAALKSLDANGRVIYMGTFSKLLFPSLRLAYLVVPEWLVAPCASALSLTSRHLPLAAQVVLREFIEEGHFARHLRHMRLLYGERAEAFRNSCERHLGGYLSLQPITTGLDATALLPTGEDDREIARRLVEAGIETRPLSFYGIEQAPPGGLILGFSAFTTEQIEHGMAAMRPLLLPERS